MKLRFSPQNLLALRAGVAATIAVSLTHAFHLERTYWAVLTAVIVLNLTWGASIRMAAQRVLMTALGVPAGWALLTLTGPSHTAHMAVLFGAISLAAYFRGAPGSRRSYPWLIFFLSVYVVFLYAAIGLWDLSLMLARLYETGLGAAIALLTSLVLLPPKETHKLEQSLTRFRDRCRAAFDALPAGPSPDTRELLQQIQEIRSSRETIFYESIIHRARARRANEAIRNAESLAHNLLALDEAAAAAPRQWVSALLDRARQDAPAARLPACDRAAALLNAAAPPSEHVHALAPVVLYAVEVRRALTRLDAALASFASV